MNRIHPEYDMEANECPYCGALLDKTVGAQMPGQRPPRPGDRSICIHCIKPMKFGDDMKLVKLTEEEEKEAMANPMVQKLLFMARSIKAMTEPEESKRYSDQLETMAEAVKAWRADNMELSPSIQYNFQTKVAVIASLDSAISEHFITVNDDAMTMFKELGWLDDKPTMPTMLMVRAVLEHVFGAEEE